MASYSLFNQPKQNQDYTTFLTVSTGSGASPAFVPVTITDSGLFQKGNDKSVIRISSLEGSQQPEPDNSD